MLIIALNGSVFEILNETDGRTDQQTDALGIPPFRSLAERFITMYSRRTSEGFMRPSPKCGVIFLAGNVGRGHRKLGHHGGTSRNVSITTRTYLRKIKVVRLLDYTLINVQDYFTSVITSDLQRWNDRYTESEKRRRLFIILRHTDAALISVSRPNVCPVLWTMVHTCFLSCRYLSSI